MVSDEKGLSIYRSELLKKDAKKILIYYKEYKTC
jgi:hypothetical protein